MTLQIVHDGKYDDYYLKYSRGALDNTFYDDSNFIVVFDTVDDARAWALEKLGEDPCADVVEYREKG